MTAEARSASSSRPLQSALAAVPVKARSKADEVDGDFLFKSGFCNDYQLNATYAYHSHPLKAPSAPSEPSSGAIGRCQQPIKYPHHEEKAVCANVYRESRSIPIPF